MATRTFPVCVEGTRGAIKTQPMVLTVPSLPAELNAAAGLWSPALVVQVQTDPEKEVDKMGDLPTANAFTYLHLTGWKNIFTSLYSKEASFYIKIVRPG